jgi:hypothetical protein
MYAEVTVCFLWLPSVVNFYHYWYIPGTNFQQGKGFSLIPKIIAGSWIIIDYARK